MSEDAHERASRVLAANFAVDGDDDDDDDDENETRDHFAPVQPSPSPELNGNVTSLPNANPVQYSSDQRDCDVEDVLQRAIDSVVSNMHRTRPTLPSDDSAFVAATFNGAVGEHNANGDSQPQPRDELDDVDRVDHDEREGCRSSVQHFQADASIANVTMEGDDDVNNVVVAAAAAATAAAADGDDDDDFGDFGDFAEPQAVPSSVVMNGDFKAADGADGAGDTGDEDDDDDFGDFEEAADFGSGTPTTPTGGFARFDEPAFAANGALVPEDSASLAPVSREAFRSLMAKLFAPVNHSSSDLVDRPVETGHFHASVRRDMARCEDVDNWPCVLFRYDSSRTRKTLLNALCVDETPANCPRFAIDCLSNEFLQPVKESRGAASGPGALAVAGDGRELSDKAKEVLSKIPDLSFMKAEVLTFPAAVQAP